MTLIEKARAITEALDAGTITPAQAEAQLMVAASRHRIGRMRQSENSLLPSEVRMGCSKKGYTRPSMR